MKQKGFVLARFLVILVVVVGIIAIIMFFAFTRDKDAGVLKNTGVNPPVAQKISESAYTETNLLALESQVETALKSGGIHPDAYLELQEKISVLESNGADLERLKIIRAKLGKLSVGGSKSGNQPKPAPVPTAQNSAPKPTQSSITTSTSMMKPTPTPSCISNPNPVFTRHITDTAKFSQIKPPPNKDPNGNLKPHSYIETHGERVPVYAPADMTLIGGAYYVGGPYMLDFRVSCEVRLRFGHISEPVQKIVDVFPDTPAPLNESRGQKITNEIQFKAGDLVAYTVGTNPGAGNWDFGVYNSSASNKYVTDPKYNQSDINTTAVCPFQYFAPDLKNVYRQSLDFSGYGNLVPDGESFCAGL